MKKFFISWKKITWIYVRFIQKILITFFLTLTYVLVFPFSWFFHLIFTKDKLLKRFKKDTTYWKSCDVISDIPENYINQS